MDIQKLNQLVKIISKGNTSSAESLFSKPGGRKYLESIVLMVLSTAPQLENDKEDLFIAFLNLMEKLEQRIKRQKEGQEILEKVYN